MDPTHTPTARLALLLADARALPATWERTDAVADALAMTHVAAVAQCVAACPVHTRTRTRTGLPVLAAC